jgi:prepilin-type N-terminal cleavage/methylation domain-containing protein
MFAGLAHLKPRHAAFSLIELIAVVAILALLAAIAAPRFGNTLVRHRVEAAANRVAADLNLARDRARASSTSQTVRFVTATDRYGIVGMADPNHPASTYRVRLDLAPYEVDLTLADFDGDADVIFDGYGMPDSSGTVVVGAGDLRISVLLNDVTGRATVGTVQVVDEAAEAAELEEAEAEGA